MKQQQAQIQGASRESPPFSSMRELLSQGQRPGLPLPSPSHSGGRAGVTGIFLGSTFFLYPQTLNRLPVPAGRESPQTQHTQDTCSPPQGTSAATWPRQVSSSAALGTSPLPRRPPFSSAWSSPPSTYPAVQVIVLSFSLGHLGKGRAGLGEEEVSLARVGPAQRKEETGVPSLED